MSQSRVRNSNGRLTKFGKFCYRDRVRYAGFRWVVADVEEKTGSYRHNYYIIARQSRGDLRVASVRSDKLTKVR